MRKALVVFFILTILSPLFSQEKHFREGDLIRALELNNIELGKLNEEIKKAALNVKDAEALYYPQIDFTFSGTYMVNPPVGKIEYSTEDILSQMGIPVSQFQTNNGYVTLYEGMENTLYLASLSLTQPLITLGKIPLSVKLFKQTQEITTLKKIDKEKQLKVELLTRFYSLSYLERISENLLKIKEETEKLLTLTKESKENGVLTNQDVLEAEIKAKEIDLFISQINKEKISLLEAIRLLTGISDLDIEAISFPDNETWLDRYKDYPLSVLRENATSSRVPSIQILNRLSSVYKTQEDIEWRRIYGAPDFALQVTTNYGGSRFPFLQVEWMQKDSLSLNFSVAMKSNLWDGGKTLNAINRAKSDREIALLDEKEAERKLIEAVDTAYNSFQYNLLKNDYLILKDESLSSRFDTTKTEVENGKKSQIDLIQDEIKVFENQIDICKNKIECLQNTFILDYLTEW